MAHVDTSLLFASAGELVAAVVSGAVGLTPAGLPVGVQVVGAPFRDRTTIAVAFT